MKLPSNSTGQRPPPNPQSDAVPSVWRPGCLTLVFFYLAALAVAALAVKLLLDWFARLGVDA